MRQIKFAVERPKLFHHRGQEENEIIVPIVLLSAVVVFFCAAAALFLNRVYGCFGPPKGQDTELTETELTSSTVQATKPATIQTAKNRKRSHRIMGEPEPDLSIISRVADQSQIALNDRSYSSASQRQPPTTPVMTDQPF